MYLFFSCRVLRALGFGLLLTPGLAAAEPFLVTNWDVLRGLTHDREAREAIELSPPEQEQLRRILEDAEVLEKLKSTRRRIQREQVGIDAEQAARLARLELDDDLRGRALKIIHAKQLQLARSYFIAQRFPDPMSPFRDHALLKDCGVDELSSDFDRELVQAAQEFYSRAKELKTSFMATVLKQLPQSSHQLMVNYIGNKYFPSLQPAKVSLSALPYSSQVLSGGSLPAILAMDDLASAIHLTAEQRQRLEAVYNARSSAISAVANGKYSEAQIRQTVEAESNKSKAALRFVLTDEQRLTLYRILAQEEIEIDVAAELRRPELIAYLQLMPEEARQLYGTASDAQQKFQSDKQALQQRAFEKQCMKLDAEPRAKLLKLFEGVWDSAG